MHTAACWYKGVTNLPHLYRHSAIDWVKHFLVKNDLVSYDDWEGYLEQNHRARFLNKNRADPKSWLEGPNRSKNGIFVILFDNGSNDLLDFLCVVKSI